MIYNNKVSKCQKSELISRLIQLLMTKIKNLELALSGYYHLQNKLLGRKRSSFRTNPTAGHCFRHLKYKRFLASYSSNEMLTL
jgi:hypothetical protein